MSTSAELSIQLANGCVIRSGWIDADDPDSLPAGDYLAVDDATGQQLFYADAADLLADPIEGRRLLCEFLQVCAQRQVAS